MAITYPLELPSVPNKMTLAMNAAVGEAVSPFTGSSQVVSWGGEWWELEMTFPPLFGDDAAAMRAFFAKLRGKEGTFLAGDGSVKTQRGSLASTGSGIAVDGANQVGRQLKIKNCRPYEIGVLAEGDYLSLIVGGVQRVYMNLSNANADSAGKITLDLFPCLRESPADGTLLTFENPRGMFRLKENLRSWEIDTVLSSGFSLSAREAF